MMLELMFKSTESLRCAIQPTGGGLTNPAWDFAMLIKNCQPLTHYTLWIPSTLAGCWFSEPGCIPIWVTLTPPDPTRLKHSASSLVIAMTFGLGACSLTGWSFYVAPAIKRYKPDSGHPASELSEKQTNASVRDLLVASDTTVSWWRSQHIASALSREQDASFESWAEDNPKTHVGGAPMPDTELFSAELNADVTGEHGTWRALAARRGQQTLMRAASSPDEADELVKGLDTLRRSGDSRHLTQAMGHLVRTGPLKPLVTAMNNIPASGWTQTTALSNFEALGLAGDLIERGDAKSSAAVRGWFAAYGDSDALAALKKGAIEGDIYALSAINSETAFDEHEAAALIEILEQRVQQTHTQALAGTGDDTSPTYCNALRLQSAVPDLHAGER